MALSAKFTAGLPDALPHLEQGVAAAAPGPARTAGAVAHAFALVLVHPDRQAEGVRVLDEALSRLSDDDPLHRPIDVLAGSIIVQDADLAEHRQRRIRDLRRRADLETSPSGATLVCWNR